MLGPKRRMMTWGYRILLLGVWAVTPPVFGGVTYTRVPLPSRYNAWTWWSTALPHLARPKNEGIQEAFRAACDFDKALPTGKTGRELERWVDSKKKYLDALTKGIAVGRLQFPPFSSAGTIDSVKLTDLNVLRNVAKIKIAKARYLMRDGRFDDAAAECLETYRMGQMFTNGDGGSCLHYLVGLSLQSFGLYGVRHLAGAQNVSPKVLTDILAKLPPASVGDPGLAQSYRVEFTCFTLPNLKKFGISMSSQADKLPKGLTNSWDHVATIKLFAAFYRRFTTNALSPWKERDRKIEADAMALLPQKEWEGVDWDITSDSEKTAEQLKKFEAIAKTCPNIFGKFFVFDTIPGMGKVHERSVQSKVKVTLTRAYVAIRLFKLKRGHLPQSLSELVTAGILSRAPRDLFSGEPVLYSRKKGKLWSVGADGVDHHGNADKDIIIELPQRGRPGNGSARE